MYDSYNNNNNVPRHGLAKKTPDRDKYNQIFSVLTIIKRQVVPIHQNFYILLSILSWNYNG